MKARSIISLNVLLFTGAAFAQNQILQWNPNISPNKYSIDQTFKRVTIHAGDPQDFCFEAIELSGGPPYAPGDINEIVVENTLNAPVYLQIRGNSSAGRYYGVRDLGKVAIWKAQPGAIRYLYASRNVATLGSVDADEFAGPIDIDGNLVNLLHAGNSSLINSSINIAGNAKYITLSQANGANLTIGGNLLLGGSISGAGWGDIIVNGAGYHEGNINISGDMSNDIVLNGPMHGTISITGALSGDIYVAGWMNWSSAITIGQGCSGRIRLDGSLNGPLSIGANSSHHMTGELDFGLNVEEDVSIKGDARGPIRIAGELWEEISIEGALLAPLTTGTVTAAGGALSIGHIRDVIHVTGDFGGRINCPGELDGEIRIAGSLQDNTLWPTYPEIEVGSMTSTAAIAIDYDGYDADDFWESGALVRINGGAYQGTYTGNTPPVPPYIWEISCVKGDLNNYSEPSYPQPDNEDIDPFALALTSPSGYAAAWPGLAGSMLYHADLNCDGLFDNEDLDPFTLKLTNPAAYYGTYTCEACPQGLLVLGGLGGGERTPEQTAALLLTYVAPQRLAAVQSAAEALAELYGGGPLGDFWAAVAALLRS